MRVLAMPSLPAAREVNRGCSACLRANSSVSATWTARIRKVRGIGPRVPALSPHFAEIFELFGHYRVNVQVLGKR